MSLNADPNDETKPFIGEDTQKQPQKAPSKFDSFKAEVIRTFTNRQSFLVLFYALMYIITGVINSLFLKKTMTALANYSIFLNQFTNFAYLPIFGSVVVYQLLFTNNISSEMLRFPLWKFAIMGALDALNGYLVVIGGIKTSGPLQQLLNQAIIPLTMIGSYFVLKERYGWLQMGGAGVILGGVVVSLIPSLINPEANKGNEFGWNMFYLTQAIPGAISNIYKDIAFKSVEIDVWYLQFWDTFWQSIFGVFLFPINNWLPEPATVKFVEFPQAMVNGTLCLAGKDLITIYNSNCTADGSLTCDACGSAPYTLPIYMAINVIYNVFILLVIKYGSATIFSIASTIRLPFTNICFAISFIMGQYTTPFSPLSVAGLVVILLGLVGYRVGGTMRAKAAEPEEQKPEGEEEEEEEGSGMRAIFSQYMVEPQPIHQVKRPLIRPKSNAELRNQYMARLGIKQNAAYGTI